MRVLLTWLLIALIAVLASFSQARPYHLSRAEHNEQRYNRLVPYTVFLPSRHRFISNFYDSSSPHGIGGTWKRVNNDDEDQPLRFG